MIVTTDLLQLLECREIWAEIIDCVDISSGSCVEQITPHE